MALTSGRREDRRRAYPEEGWRAPCQGGGEDVLRREGGSRGARRKQTQGGGGPGAVGPVQPEWCDEILILGNLIVPGNCLAMFLTPRM